MAAEATAAAIAVSSAAFRATAASSCHLVCLSASLNVAHSSSESAALACAAAAASSAADSLASTSLARAPWALTVADCSWQRTRSPSTSACRR